MFKHKIVHQKMRKILMNICGVTILHIFVKKDQTEYLFLIYCPSESSEKISRTSVII